jgi:CheY-like chemotaxis protein
MPEPQRIVLCVDDDPDDREVVCYTISEIDPSLKVAHATDGVEAIEYLAKAKEQDALPCLVILDINMPRLNGKQTLAVIKKDAALREVPIVIFSTSNNPMDKVYCERYGVELITKPSTMPQMHHEVKRLLQPCVEG